jgi:hypothetical protein
MRNRSRSEISLLRDLVREMAFYGRFIPTQDIEPEEGDPVDWGSSRRTPEQMTDARKKLAYMSTPAWAEKAEATYRDVEIPIAVIPMPSFTGEAANYPEGGARAVPGGRSEAIANQVFRMLGTDRSELPDDLLTLIVTSPEHDPAEYRRLASPWIIFHGLFDDVPDTSFSDSLTKYSDEMFDLIDQLASCYDKRPSAQFLTHAILTMGSARDYNIKNLSDSGAEIIVQALLKPSKFEVKEPPMRLVGADGSVSTIRYPNRAASLRRTIEDRAREIAQEVWPLLAGRTILVRV